MCATRQTLRRLLLTLIGLTCVARLPFASAQAASSNSTIARSSNVTGSLGYQCSSAAGILNLTQAAAAGQDQNVTIPTNLTNAAAVQEIAQIAWEYIYSYPLPIVAKTLAGGSANGTAVNTFYSYSGHLSTSNDTGVVAPNHDTLYSSAFLDLSQGPHIITVPTFDSGRYWVVPFLDAYTNFYASIGATSNSSAGQYLVVGRGASPNATYSNFTSNRIIHAPTDISWVIARVLVFNDSDTAAANRLLSNITISSYNVTGNASTAAPKARAISQAVNGSGFGPAATQVGYLTSLSQNPDNWFNASALYVNIDPPAGGFTSLDTTLTGLSSTARNASSLALTAFQLADQIATQCITNGSIGLTSSTGWTFSNNSGSYGTDYLQRAQTARSGLGALPPSEAIYFTATQDSQNRTLDASTGNSYTVNFTLPIPADAFWSLTLYNASSYLLVANSIDRYSIGGLTSGLSYSGTNNSQLSVYIAAQQPSSGSAQRANWLPAPSDSAFELILRLYEPQSSALAGRFAPPPVVRNAAAAS